MISNNIDALYYPSKENPEYIYSIINDKLHYKYGDWERSSWYLMSCKSATYYKELLKAYEKLKENLNETN